MRLQIAEPSDNLRLTGTESVAANKKCSKDVDDARRGYCTMEKGTFADGS